MSLFKNKSLKSGAPERIRTSDRLVRSQVLYPAELQAHIVLSIPRISCIRNMSLFKNKSLKSGAPERIRTSDRLVRSQVLYPAELQAHMVLSIPLIKPYQERKFI